MKNYRALEIHSNPKVKSQGKTLKKYEHYIMIEFSQGLIIQYIDIYIATG